jgi:hypothetical protein
VPAIPAATLNFPFRENDIARRFPLRPIPNDEHNNRAAEICDLLTDRIDLLSQAERDYLEVLTDLIAKYESRWKRAGNAPMRVNNEES